MKFTKEKIAECAEWVANNGLAQAGGATIRSFCKAMGIDDATYRRWLQNAAFAEEIKKAKEKFAETLVVEVENNLRKKARGGFLLESVKTVYESGADGKPYVVSQTKETKQAPPDTAANIFLLCNLAPGKWQQKQTTTHEAGESLPDIKIQIVDPKGQKIGEIE